VIVLITGAAGFIGHKLAARFCARGDDVVCVDDFSSGSRHNLRGLHRLTIVEGCVTCASTAAAAVEHADLMVHLASVVGQIPVTRDPEWAARVSAESTRLLLEAAPNTPFVLFSSSAIYGLTESEICSESALVTPNTALAYDGGTIGYASGKWQAEQLALAAAATRPVLILRPFNVVGPGQVGAYGMVIPRFVDRALHDAPLEIYGDGTQSRSFSHIDTFLYCVMQLIDRWPAGTGVETVYNIGAPTMTTINGLAREVESAMGRKLVTRYIPFDSVFPGKKDVRGRIPSTEKLEHVLGPVAWPPIGDVIRDVIAAKIN
jgi:UDP-glucose 4-epimerase